MSRKLHGATAERQSLHDGNSVFVNAVLDKIVIECERRESAGTSGEFTVRMVWKDGRVESARLTPEEIIRATA